MNTLLIIGQLLPKPESLPDVTAGGGQIETVLQIVFALAGAITVIVVIIGGFNYVISNGDPQRVSRAKNTILYALIGLVISIFAFTIVTFALGKVFG